MALCMGRGRRGAQAVLQAVLAERRADAEAMLPLKQAVVIPQWICLTGAFKSTW